MKHIEIILNIADIIFRVLNFFIPGLILYLLVIYIATKRKKVRLIIILTAIELSSILYYIFLIKSDYWGKGILWGAEWLSFFFSLFTNNVVYLIMMANKFNHNIKFTKRILLTTISPALTICIIIFIALSNKVIGML